MDTDIFLVENGNSIALFVPERGLLLEINSDERRAIELLFTRSDFTFEMITSIFPEVQLDQLMPSVAKGDASDVKEFRPTDVVLFTTSDCGLRCTYCYSNAGVKQSNMSRQVAQAAIDFIISNAKTTNCDKCSLQFHGGGEPTFNWEIFQFALEYFSRAKSEGLHAGVTISTNGMLSTSRAEWIADRLSVVQVSMDGTEDIQNAQRPTRFGGKSYEQVSRTIDVFLSRKIELVLHSVVTELGVDNIPATIKFLVNRFPGLKTIHLEPAFSCGRGLSTGQKFPSPQSFVDGFIEAESIARACDVELFYSGAGPQVARYRSSFCGATYPNFVVTPSGLVTACHEVSEMSHCQAGKVMSKHF